MTLRAVLLAQVRLVLAYLMLRKTLIGTIVMLSLTGLCAIGDGIPAIRISPDRQYLI